MRSVSNFKFELLSLRYVLRIVNEPILELSVFGWLCRPERLLGLLSELLELETLKVDFLQAFHAWVVFSYAFEGAF